MTDISVFEIKGDLSDGLISSMLPMVSAWRKEQALEFKFPFGRFACLKSYIMLSEMTGLKDFGFEYGEFGKPSIKGHPEIHFNISHCRKAIAVAVSDCPVGIDVESDRNISDGLVERVMNPVEQSAIRGAASQQQEFLRLWTRKEAVLKLRGTGIVDNMSDVLNGTELVSTTECDGYVWSVAQYPGQGGADLRVQVRD